MKQIIFTAILILAFCLTALGQKSKAVKKIDYLTTPFELSLNTLTPNFLGHNASFVFSSLVPLAAETQIGCGKFEKSQDCQDRLNRLYDKTLWKDFTARDLLTFSIPIECGYNADAEKFWCSSSFNGYTWSHKKIGSDTYTGQNAFGVKKIVKYEKFENIIIEVDRTKPDFTLKDIKPDEARRLNSNLRLLIIGEILQPFVRRKNVSYKPTLNEPNHTEGDNKFIIIEVKEIWIYDFETGKVFEKKKYSG